MEITSVADLIGHVRSIRQDHDQEFWFRGHRCCDWRVEPAIQRRYTAPDERNLTNRFRSRAAVRYPKSPKYDEIAHWLSIMQHYGLPTRLLDWSRSPLIAAYFAIWKYPKDIDVAPCDACVWMLDPFRLNVSEGFKPITPAIDSHECENMLIPAFSDNPCFPENNKIRAVMAAETDLRMFVQRGCFTIHSRRKVLYQADGAPNFLWQMKIPATFVKGFADELRECGFRQGDVFPDLANLADELRISHPPGWSGP